ncbi:MAG: hypothetical protein R3C12_26255, partial [Planctomycetaceae bacterium]
ASAVRASRQTVRVEKNSGLSGLSDRVGERVAWPPRQIVYRQNNTQGDQQRAKSRAESGGAFE